MVPSRDEKDSFSLMIIDRVETENIDYMDAILTYCDENELEVEIIATLVNDVLKCKLELEAQSLNYIEKTSKLPL